MSDSLRAEDASAVDSSRKEIYTYEAPWPVYAMAWSQRYVLEYPSHLQLNLFFVLFTHLISYYDSPLTLISHIEGDQGLTFDSR